VATDDPPLAWRHPWLLLAAGAAALAGCIALAARLELRSNFAELLPSGDPAVVELTRLDARLPPTAVLQVAIESPDRAANRRFARDLLSRLEALGPDVLDSATFDVSAERRFLDQHRWLYARLADLEALRDATQSELDRRKNPLLVDLLDHEPPRRLLDRMREKKDGFFDRFPDGVFERADGTLAAIVLRPASSLFAERAGERLVAFVKEAVAALDPARYHPALQVGLTGDVMAQLDERAALERDLFWASAICVGLVGLAVLLAFRRPTALVWMALPAFSGVAAGFAAAKLAFGYLTASTAFLGSIVVGNGINFPIILMARYDEERRRGLPPAEAITVAVGATRAVTALAAAGAAVAYGALMVTRFRGFFQFGVIGMTGMLAAWGATYALVPAGLRLQPGRRPPPPPPYDALARRLGKAALRHRRATWLVALLLLAGAGLPLARFLGDPFEYDFRRLRSERSVTAGAEAWAKKVDPLFGLTLTPSVVLAERPEQVHEVKRLLLARDRAGLLGRVTTVWDVLPGPPDEQEKKLAVLTELRRLCDRPELRDAEDEADRKLVADLRPPERLRKLGVADLPASLRRPFTERDGTVGRIVLVYHGEHVSVWDGRNLIALAALMETLPLSDGTIIRSSGHAVVFASMIRSIQRDAPRATLAVLLGVMALVVLSGGRRGGRGAVLASLVWGTLVAFGAAALFGLKANFLDFIALPITLGIGVDYAVNLRGRWAERGQVKEALSATGGAVTLCSLTTIIGYGALLAADNQALRSFGGAAIGGEVACLVAALTILPLWLSGRSSA
jgi:hypothetical protein